MYWLRVQCYDFKTLPKGTCLEETNENTFEAVKLVQDYSSMVLSSAPIIYLQALPDLYAVGVLRNDNTAECSTYVLKAVLAVQS